MTVSTDDFVCSVEHRRGLFLPLVEVLLYFKKSVCLWECFVRVFGRIHVSIAHGLWAKTESMGREKGLSLAIL